MASIELNGVGKVYENGTEAVRSIDLTIEEGEFLVLVGPSGCGKSTLLRMIAGLEDLSAGHILLNGQEMTGLAPEERNLAMVFQSYALYPHMSVERNLGFGLKLRKVAKEDSQTRVADAARVLGLEELLDRKPAELSGGQRQRVALGRAMVRDPHAYLMDEPLSNLDAKLRVAMRAELARLHERLGVTTIYVTHDQTEAMTLGQRVAVLRDGVLQQCAAPLELFEQPANLFVAGFIGSPQMNLVEARVGTGTIEFGAHSIPLANDDTAKLPEQVVLGIRPTDLHLPEATAGRNLPTIPIVPSIVEELGSERMVLFPVDATMIELDARGGVRKADSMSDARLIADDSRAYFSARLPARAPVTTNHQMSLAVDTDWLYVFDPDDGRVLRAPSSDQLGASIADPDS